MANRETELAAELDRLGEAEVRARLAKGEFGMIGSARSMFVNQWLAGREHERRSANGKTALSQSEAAKATAAAALSQAHAAAADSRRASVMAVIALICSVLALLVAWIK